MRRVRFKIKKVLLCVILIFLCVNNNSVNAFTPMHDILDAGAVKSGEGGYLLTVLRGTEPEKLPIKVISVISQSSQSVGNYILIKMLKGEIARGMSGSPVYIKRGSRDYLIGALSIGWDFGDHSTAVVTPINDMIKIADNINNVNDKNNSKSLKNTLGSVNVSGISRGAALKLSENLGLELAESVNSGANSNIKVNIDYKFRPGDAIAALLAWGDVEIAATGTVTEVGRNNKNNINNGEFLAFGHPFLKRGAVNYPAARAFVHDVIKSVAFPFKIASPEFISGTVMRDMEAGIAGRTGYLAPSIGAELNFKDLDTGYSTKRAFRVVNDEFLSAKILEGAYNGLIEDVWGRKGQGTMRVNLRVDGKGIENGWARNDIFYSDSNIESVALKQPMQYINMILTQPFNKIAPIGFRIDIEASSKPRALLIEDVEILDGDEIKAGAEFSVKVKLRPWRGSVITREFKLKMPESASGTCELVVRGGGTQPASELAIEGGWMSIDSFSRLLDEIKALDANNELIIELQSDPIGELLNNLNNLNTLKSKNKNSAKSVEGKANKGELSGKNNRVSDKNSENINNKKLLKEETEYLSETKTRRIKEGSMRVFRTEYFVDGLLRRVIDVK